MDNVQIVKKNGWGHGWRIKVMDRSSKDIWAVSRAVQYLDHQEKCPERTHRRRWIQFQSCEGLISPEKLTCLVFSFQNHQLLVFIDLHWKWRNKSWNLKIHEDSIRICSLLKHTSGVSGRGCEGWNVWGSLISHTTCCFQAVLHSPPPPLFFFHYVGQIYRLCFHNICFIQDKNTPQKSSRSSV